jgi:predicted transcriptional regulator
VVNATRTKGVATKLPRVVFHVPEELKEELEQLANKRRRSVSNLVRTLVEEAVEKAKKRGELQ